jgi:hypothetical protein
MTESLSYMMQTTPSERLGRGWASTSNEKIRIRNGLRTYLHKTVVYFKSGRWFQKKVKDVTGSVYVRGSSSAEDDARQQGMVARQSMTRKWQKIKSFRMYWIKCQELRGSIGESSQESLSGNFAHRWERDPKQPENTHYMITVTTVLFLSTFDVHADGR